MGKIEANVSFMNPTGSPKVIILDLNSQDRIG